MLAEAKSVQVNLRLSSALKARAEKAAAQDHRSLTSLVEKLLAEHLQGRASLQNWHRNAQTRFEELLLKRGQASALMPKSFRALSFAINTTHGCELKPQDLLQTVRSLPSGLRGVFLNPTLFHAYTRPELAPYYTADANDAGGSEILESVVLPDVSTLDTVDFWRLAPSGLASHFRTYNEDREGLRSVCSGGKWFWPYQLIRDLHELVLHAFLLSEHFKTSESVEFRCEWWGLQGREIADAEPEINWMPGKIAKEDHRITQGEWVTGKLLNDTPEIVSVLAAPVLRLFDPTFDCSPDWARQQTLRFKRLG